MKLDARDWQKLQLPLLGLGLVIVIVTLLYGYTARQEERVFAALQEQRNHLNQARDRYRASGNEKDTIEKYLPLYQNLIARGFIGEERRIDWIDDLRHIHQRYKLFGITYNIGPRETYKPSFIQKPGPFVLHRSVMDMEIALLHEGDLLTVADALAQKYQSLLMMRDCEITRLAASGKNKFVPNLTARCEMDWLTLEEPQKLGSQP